MRMGSYFLFAMSARHAIDHAFTSIPCSLAGPRYTTLLISHSDVWDVLPFTSTVFSVRSTASQADNLRRKEERHEQAPRSLPRRG